MDTTVTGITPPVSATGTAESVLARTPRDSDISGDSGAAQRGHRVVTPFVGKAVNA